MRRVLLVNDDITIMKSIVSALTEFAPGHLVACHFASRIDDSAEQRPSTRTQPWGSDPALGPTGGFDVRRP